MSINKLRLEVREQLAKATVDIDFFVSAFYEDGVVTLTLNQPQRLNVLDKDFLIALYQAIESADTDPLVKAIILTGGNSVFSAGFDISSLYAQRHYAIPLALSGQCVCQHIQQCSKPVIAAINGVALGGGYELALSTHYRVISRKTRIALPEITLGIMPGFGGTQRLSRLVGCRTTALFCLSGEQLLARRAQRYGFVDTIAEDAWHEAKNIARAWISGQFKLPVKPLEHEALQSSPLLEDSIIERLVQQNQEKGQKQAACLIVQAIEQGASQPLETGEALETTLFAQAMQTDEASAGLEAFLNGYRRLPLTMPAVFPVSQLEYIPTTRQVWLIRQEGKRGTPTTALERAIVPVPDLGDEDVLVKVLVTPAEANAGRWLPQGKPVDILAIHRLKYHIPGNNAVGIVVARGALVPDLPHLQLGSLVVTHNASTRDSHDSRMLRGDPDMELFVTGYDEFRAKPDGPFRSGTYADYVAVDYERVMPKPSHLTLVEAAVYLLAEPTILHSNRRTQLGKGDTLLLVGAAGSTGLRAIEMAKFLGVKRVIGLVSTETKKARIEALSQPGEFEVIGLLRTEFDFANPNDIERFIQVILQNNQGKLADVAIDFLGDNNPNVLFKAVRSGYAGSGIRQVGRLTAYGAELNPLVVIDGVPGSATVETMFQAVEEVRDLPETDTLLKLSPLFLGDHPEVLEAIKLASEQRMTERAIKRVLTYGFDRQTLDVLLSAKKRQVKVAVVVRDAEESRKLWQNLVQTGEFLSVVSEDCIFALDKFYQGGVIDESGLLKQIRLHLGDKPDVIVERSDSQQLLGLPAEVQTLKMSHFRFLRPGGQVIFAEDTSHCRFCVDMRAWVTQRDILFPSKYIILTHYASQTECWLANERIKSKQIVVSPPDIVMSFDEIPEGLEKQREGKIVFYTQFFASLM